jgi:hypothetical protein
VEAGKGSVDDIRNDAIIVATSIFDKGRARDRMTPTRERVIHSLWVALVLGILATSAFTQPLPKPKRLHAPATIRGLVGGEANDTYVMHVRKGKVFTVEISWKKEDDNTASFFGHGFTRWRDDFIRQKIERGT